MDEKLSEQLIEIFDAIKVPKKTVSKTKNSTKKFLIQEDKISTNNNVQKRIVYQVEGHKRKLTQVLCTAAAFLILFIGTGTIIFLKEKGRQSTVTIQTNTKENIQATEEQGKAIIDTKNIEPVIENNINSVFEGKIGTKNIRMALYRDGDNLTASYITQNDEDGEINLHGTIQINNASFNLYSDIKDIFLKGNIIPYTKEEDGYIEGTYTSGKNEPDVHFSLSRSYAIDSSFKKRYSRCTNATTTEVEGYAKKIKKYIAKDNINDFVNLISFPIYVNIKNSRVKINNAREFKQKYNDIISTDFKARILKVYTKYLMCKYEGVMLGLGEIWFTSYKDDGKLEIIAINN